MLLFLFVNYWLIFLNCCSYCKIFDPTAELVIPIGIPTKEAKAEMETHPVVVEPKLTKCSI